MKCLQKLREAKQWSQIELSRRSGVPQSMISDIEKGKIKFPRVDTASKLAKALECSIEELID